MIEQRIKSKSIPPLRGMLLVLAIVAGLFVASLLSQLLSRFVPAVIPTACVWLLTGGFVFLLMRRSIVEYNYIVSERVLYVERLYGQRSKVLLQLPVLDIVSISDPAAAKAAHPELGRALDCTLSDCPLPKKAITYKAKGAYHWIILQPDERISPLLWDEQARQQAAKEKWG